MIPQARKILEILQDGQKHCPIDWEWKDGHGKRLTDINRYLKKSGKFLAWAWCDCGRHTTKIKMRWIAKMGLEHIIPILVPQNPTTGIVASNNAIPVSSQSPLFTYKGLPIEI